MADLTLRPMSASELHALTALFDYNDVPAMIAENTRLIESGAFSIYLLFEGDELIGVVDRNGLVEKIPYSVDNDVPFYEDPALSGAVLLQAEDFVVLAPEDAHKPRCIAGEAMPVKKIVVNVPV